MDPGDDDFFEAQMMREDINSWRSDARERSAMVRLLLPLPWAQGSAAEMPAPICRF